jgi:cation diffusion facilitator family transporter
VKISKQKTRNSEQGTTMAQTVSADHGHVFLGHSHERNERRTWTVIVLCSTVMVAEIAGGILFGSIALVADGLHMSTHASALLLAAWAYRYARRHAHDDRFSFGTGKLGDLSGFASAVVLAMIALLIGYEAVTRLIWPVPIDFNEVIPIAALGLIVNIASALLLGGGHRHDHDDDDDHDRDRAHRHAGSRTSHEHGQDRSHSGAHAATRRDNNMRAAIVHVIADAAVSILVIFGLTLGRLLGWTWIDPVVGLFGTVVIAAWAYTLIRDTGAVLLDMNPDRGMAERVRATIESDGDRLTDLHLWRLGPGHLAVIVAVATQRQRGVDYYRSLLARFSALSHLTVQVQQQVRQQ